MLEPIVNGYRMVSSTKIGTTARGIIDYTLFSPLQLATPLASLDTVQTMAIEGKWAPLK